ncbi:MAG TPA: hypothetical protein VEK07_10140 [Polyangiaceae bacterium]|nr:hypothetical protein [Polyangiaceae bacterium]
MTPWVAVRAAAAIGIASLFFPFLACSGQGPSSGGGGASGGSGAVGTHAPLPQVENNGGGILTAPEIVTVTYAPSQYANVNQADAPTFVSDLQAFDDGITSTSWWTTVTKDYCGTAGCVGQPGPHVSIAAAPPGDGTSTCDTVNGQSVQPCYTDSAIGGTASLKTYLTGLFNAGTLPAPTAQTLYVIYMPSSVVINVDGALSCVTIGGYHDSVGVGTLDVPYAIIPLCEPEAVAGNTPQLSLEQTATLAASHEIVEATTDPHGGEVPPGGNPYSTQYLGWYLTDAASQPWAFFAGGEIADLCVDILGLGQDRWTEGQFTYQRVWSNSQAAASQDPCVPTPAGDVYFNAGPTTVEDEQIELSQGQSASLPIAAFSNGPMPNWLVMGADNTDAEGNPLGVLTFTPSITAPTAVQNGLLLSLQVTLVKQPPAQAGEPAGTPPFEPYLILSLFASDAGAVTAGHYWPGFVIGSQ